MVTSLQHAATGRAVRLAEWLDVLAVEVGSGVHPVKMDKPTKELDLTGEFALPNELGTCQFDVVSMEETVSTTTRKEGRARTVKPPLVGGVPELERRESGVENIELASSLVGKPGLKDIADPRGQSVMDTSQGPFTVGEEGRETRAQKGCEHQSTDQARRMCCGRHQGGRR